MSTKEEKVKLAKFDLKFVRELGRVGGKVEDKEGTTAYFLPYMIARHKEAMPVGVYAVVHFRDAPDSLLESFGLQKIPAKHVQ